VLPVAKNGPSGLLERRTLLGISFDIPPDLRRPVCVVRVCTASAVLRTAVPPAAINKAADPEPREGDVRPDRTDAADVDRKVNAIPEATSMKEDANSAFRPRIAPPVCAHVGAAMRRAWGGRNSDRHVRGAYIRDFMSERLLLLWAGWLI
jgi:hypothetical protein